MLSEIKIMDEKADDGYSLLSYLKVLPGHSDNRRLKVKWDWSSMEIAQSLLQQAKILYYNDLDVDISGQEIIQDYRVKEFDLTNLHPDTKYLICFRVTRKRFLSLDLSNNETMTIKQSSPSLILRSNNTKLIDTNSSSIINNPHLQYMILKRTSSSGSSSNQLISNNNSPALNQPHAVHSINIPKINDEYVAEMKCQLTFTQFLHWTAILCSLIGIIIALLLSITIFVALKSRAYRTKHHDRKMFLKQKGLLSGRRIGGGENGVEEDEEEEDGDGNGEDALNTNKLRHTHNHSHHSHSHHHHYHHPHPTHHQHQHHHHCHHLAHSHNQNQHHSHYHCHLNSSKKSLLMKQEHSTRCSNHQKMKSTSSPLSSSSPSSPSCLKSSSDKTGGITIRDKSLKHHLTTTEVICETHGIKPGNSSNNTTNELHLSEKQLEDWENELKNIEESNDILSENTKNLVPLIKPPPAPPDIYIPTTTTTTTTNNNKPQKIPQTTIPQDSLTLLDSIESIKEMETKRTVSFKEDNIIPSPSIKFNQNMLKKDVHLINMTLTSTSTQPTSLFDAYNDEIYNLNKPISISPRECHLIHSRHHIPESLITDSNNNDSLLFHSINSINKQVSVNKTLSSSSNNKDISKDNNNKWGVEICSPLLKDVIDSNIPSTIQEMTTLVSSVQNQSTTGRKLDTTITTTTIDNNNILLNTSIDSRKRYLENDQNWHLTSKESSNILIGQNEQKTIFHTQLIETL